MWWLAPQLATASQIVCPPTLRAWPPPGTVVPTNARFFAEISRDQATGDVVFEIAGVRSDPQPGRVWRGASETGDRLWAELVPPTLPPGGEVVLRIGAWSGTWRIGDGPDEVPPAFTGVAQQVGSAELEAEVALSTEDAGPVLAHVKALGDPLGASGWLVPVEDGRIRIEGDVCVPSGVLRAGTTADTVRITLLDAAGQEGDDEAWVVVSARPRGVPDEILPPIGPSLDWSVTADVAGGGTRLCWSGDVPSALRIGRVGAVDPRDHCVASPRDPAGWRVRATWPDGATVRERLERRPVRTLGWVQRGPFTGPQAGLVGEDLATAGSGDENRLVDAHGALVLDGEAPLRDATDVVRAPDGTWWVARCGHLLWRRPDETWFHRIPLADGLCARDLEPDGAGGLWIAAREQVLHRGPDGRIEAHPVRADRVAVGTDGVFAASYEGGLQRFDGTWQPTSGPERPTDLLAGPDGTVWTVAAERAWSWSDGAWTPADGDDRILALGFGPDGARWTFGRTETIRSAPSGEIRWPSRSIPGGSPASRPRWIADRWEIGTAALGLVRFSSDGSELATTTHELSGLSALAADGGTLLATTGAAVFRIDPADGSRRVVAGGGVVARDTPEGLLWSAPEPGGRTVRRGPGGPSLGLVLDEDPLHLASDHVVGPTRDWTRDADGWHASEHPRIRLYTERDGVAWEVDDGGLRRRGSTEVVPLPEVYARARIEALVLDPTGRLWVRTSLGVASWKDGWTVLPASWSRVDVAPDGAIWLGSASQTARIGADGSTTAWPGGASSFGFVGDQVWRFPSVERLYGGGWRPLHPPLPDVALTRRLVRSDDGALWVTLDRGGLVRYDPDRRQAAGVAGISGATAVVADGDGVLVVGPGGLSRVGPDLGVTLLESGRSVGLVRDPDGRTLWRSGPSGVERGAPGAWEVVDTVATDRLLGADADGVVAIRPCTFRESFAERCAVRISAGGRVGERWTDPSHLPGFDVAPDAILAPDGAVWWDGHVAVRATGDTSAAFHGPFGDDPLTLGYAVGADGGIWVGTSDGLARWTPGAGTLVGVAGTEGMWVGGLADDGDGGVWLSLGHALAHVRADGTVAPHPLDLGPVPPLAISGGRVLIPALRGHGVFDGERWTEIPGAPSPSVALAVDGDRWWSLGADGVVLASDGTTDRAPLGAPRGLAFVGGQLCAAGERVFCRTGQGWYDQGLDGPFGALAAVGGVGWAGTDDGRICRLDGTCEPGEGAVRALAFGGGDRWVLRDRRVDATLSDGGTVVVPLDDGRAIAADADGAWVGTARGLIRIDRAGEVRAVDDAGPVHAVVRDGDRVVWIADREVLETIVGRR